MKLKCTKYCVLNTSDNYNDDVNSDNIAFTVTSSEKHNQNYQNVLEKNFKDKFIERNKNNKWE